MVESVSNSAALISDSIARASAEGTAQPPLSENKVVRLQIDVNISEQGKARLRQEVEISSAQTTAAAAPSQNSQASTPNSDSVTVSTSAGGATTAGGLSREAALALYQSIAGQL